MMEQPILGTISQHTKYKKVREVFLSFNPRRRISGTPVCKALC